MSHLSHNILNALKSNIFNVKSRDSLCRIFHVFISTELRVHLYHAILNLFFVNFELNMSKLK